MHIYWHSAQLEIDLSMAGICAQPWNKKICAQISPRFLPKTGLNLCTMQVCTLDLCTNTRFLCTIEVCTHFRGIPSVQEVCTLDLCTI